MPRVSIEEAQDKVHRGGHETKFVLPSFASPMPWYEIPKEDPRYEEFTGYLAGTAREYYDKMRSSTRRDDKSFYRDCWQISLERTRSEQRAMLVVVRLP